MSSLLLLTSALQAKPVEMYSDPYYNLSRKMDDLAAIGRLADELGFPVEALKANRELLTNPQFGITDRYWEAAAFTRAMEVLADPQSPKRTVIVLREIDGLSYEEIAFSLGVAIGTVKSRLTRARQTLRDELREVRP